MAEFQPVDVEALLATLPQPELPALVPASAPDTFSAPAPAPAAATTPAPDTAPAAATTPAADSATPATRVATSTNRVAEHLMHKNRLQEYAQRSSIPLPIYHTVNEGSQHAPKFKSTVLVDGVSYTSPNTFTNRKAAEQDVAKLALECISKKIKDEGCPLINQDTIFCKSILNEFAVKMNLEKPTYNTIQPEGLLPVFVSSLVFDGVKYTGETGRNKKEAEQLAARAVILSLLGTSGSATVLSEIIKSKAKLYAALHKVKDSNCGIQSVGVNQTHSSGMLVDNAVETATVTNNMSTGATLEPSSGTHPPHHQFKMPKLEPSSEAVNLPISFVPPVLGEPLGVGASSPNKRRKNKRKANKKLRTDAQPRVTRMYYRKRGAGNTRKQPKEHPVREMNLAGSSRGRSTWLLRCRRRCYNEGKKPG